MQKADPLIRTKLCPPLIRPDLVPRPRLQEQIARGLCGPLTLIIAPAGYGKTTLVASCIAGCGMPTAWLSLDKNDNQPGRFLSYVTAALHGIDQRIGNEAAGLLTGIQPATAEAVLIELINDLDRIGGEIALVLDDYQFIASQAVHEATVFLLEHSPRTLHLVVASRSDPPLPLARLRALGQTVELRAADLRFTEPEATRFLNEVMDLHLGAEAVAALEERTEGWIAGLQMASLALQASLTMRERKDVRQFIAGFSGTHRYILDYLLEEVLAAQPPEIEHFLLRTSILERLTAPLCDFLFASDEGPDPAGDRWAQPRIQSSASALEYLERANLFLAPLDDERIWFRYHHLFADLLRARLNQALPDEAHRLRLRAAAWLEEKDLIPEAIHQLFTAQEVERAADLIERHGPARLSDGDPTVLQLADGLPQAVIISRPKIGLYQIWMLICEGRIGKAISLMNGLRSLQTAAEINDERRWMHTMIATALAFLAPPNSAPEANPLPDDQMLDEIPANEPILRNAADFLYVMALARREELDRAVEIAARCIQAEKPLENSLVIPSLAPFLTRIYIIQGRLHTAESMCRRFLAPIREGGARFIYTAGSMQIDLGEALYEWNRLEEAESHIRNGLSDNEPWRNIMTDGFGLTALARVLQAKGDFTGALQIVEKLENRLKELPRPREFEEELRTLRVRVQLAAGNLQDPIQWADRIERSTDYELHRECYRLTLARIRLAQGRYAEVTKMVAGLLPQLSTRSRISRQLEADLLQAAAAAGQQRLAEALQRIDAALALAEPEGYIRTFLDTGEPARELLQAYLRSPAAARKLYAQKILDAFSNARPAATGKNRESGLIEPLTERELEVLRLIAEGRTNREIAGLLIVSPGTVKAHTAGIYRKLDVANRTEAAARARELGILS